MRGQGPYVLGIDCGTQSLRVAIVELSGKVVASASQEYPIDFPQVSWAEQRAEDWWDAAKAMVPKALAEAGLSGDDIAGVSVDGTSCTVVVTTRDGKPLRPVILWMDQRAHREAAEITATKEPVLKYVSWQESPEWMLPKALWLKRHEGEVFEQADLIIEGTDWLMHRLTGEWAASLNNTTCKWNYAKPEGGWPDALLERMELTELRGKWPDRVLAMGDRAGALTAAAADALGLKAGTPVAQGGIDAYAAMLGVGVVHPGRMALVMGTSTCHMALAAEGLFDSHVWGPYPDCLLPDTWVLEGGQTATGAIVQWFISGFGAAAQAQAEREGRDVYEVLDAMAEEAGVGAEGLVLCDYWQGNRTPIRDPLARGIIWGLSLKHGPGHVFRAIYEGTALGTRHILEDLKAAGYSAEGIYACGGGARSAVWLQIHADACQTPIYLTQEPEATAVGTAVCAAVGAGLFASPVEAAEQMAHITREILPDESKADQYDFLFDKYVRTYPPLREMMHEVAQRYADRRTDIPVRPPGDGQQCPSYQE